MERHACYGSIGAGWWQLGAPLRDRASGPAVAKRRPMPAQRKRDGFAVERHAGSRTAHIIVHAEGVRQTRSFHATNSSTRRVRPISVCFRSRKTAGVLVGYGLDRSMGPRAIRSMPVTAPPAQGDGNRDAMMDIQVQCVLVAAEVIQIPNTKGTVGSPSNCDDFLSHA